MSSSISRPELAGKFVRLEPLALEHVSRLWDAVRDHHQAVFEWTRAQIASAADLETFIRVALEEEARGESVPFMTVEQTQGRAIGSTRFMNIDRPNRKLEIGHTWIATPWQRSAINTEAKLLMLEHAFESWKCLRVEFKTDALNQRSRQAILRLGAKEEGTLRKHMVLPSGRVRDTVFFSITDDEWQAVKQRLQQRLFDSRL